MSRVRPSFVPALLVAALAAAAAGSQPDAGVRASCAPDAAALVDRGVVLLHALAHREARERFEQAAAADPSCAMAFWGQAMSWTPALDDPAGIYSIPAGLEAVGRARAAAPATPRERRYVAAATAFFETDAPLPARLLRQREAFEDLHAAHPEDAEAAAFFARSLLLLEGGDRHRNLSEAAAVIERAFGPRPNHPGAAMYLTYAHDLPDRAPEGLPIADHYRSIASGTLLARHVPSHIYARLGRWQMVAEVEETAWAAAGMPDGPASPDAPGREPAMHSLRWRFYARLQLGQFAGARAALARARELARSDASLRAGTIRMSARLALEEGAWEDALALAEGELPESAVEVATYASGLAAARLAWPGGREQPLTLARAAAARLEAMAAADPTAEMARLSILAAMAAAQEERNQMTVFLTHLIDIDTRRPDPPVLADPLIPVHELAGDLWWQVHRYEDAQQAYAEAVRQYPGRARALAGLARAAARAGDAATARQAAAELLDQWSAADAARPELGEMRTIVGSRQ